MNTQYSKQCSNGTSIAWSGYQTIAHTESEIDGDPASTQSPFIFPTGVTGRLRAAGIQAGAPMAVLLEMLISWHADGSDIVVPGEDRLARLTQYTTRQVRRACRVLVREGILRRIGRLGGSGMTAYVATPKLLGALVTGERGIEAASPRADSGTGSDESFEPHLNPVSAREGTSCESPAEPPVPLMAETRPGVESVPASLSQRLSPSICQPEPSRRTGRLHHLTRTAESLFQTAVGRASEEEEVQSLSCALNAQGEHTDVQAAIARVIQEDGPLYDSRRRARLVRAACLRFNELIGRVPNETETAALREHVDAGEDTYGAAVAVAPAITVRQAVILYYCGKDDPDFLAKEIRIALWRQMEDYPSREEAATALDWLRTPKRGYQHGSEGCPNVDYEALAQELVKRRAEGNTQRPQ